MRKEKHMVPILVRWLSEGSHLLCYQDAVLCLFTTSHLRSVWHSVSHVCMGGRNAGQSESRYCKPFISKARPLVDLVRRLIRVLSSILAGWFVPSFASCAAPRSACLSLSSQWPILHHRWGRQKGETTARLLFGETRSVQLSERRGREGEWEGEERMELKM